VRFGAATAASFTVNSATSITAVSTPQAAGTVDVTVTTPGGTSAISAADQFTYAAPPTVTGVNPNAGPTGGGTSVTITGTNFSGATVVKFAAFTAASFTVNSATSITAVSPSHEAGTVDVTVTAPGGTSAISAADQFTYVAAPTVTGVIPNRGPTGGGTSVTISGTSFTGATAVQFGGVAATSFTVNSTTSIAAVSPAQAPGTVDLTVTAPGGTSAISAADQFTYSASEQPSVMLSPTSLNFGNQNVGTLSDAQTVTVTNNGNAPLTITLVDLIGPHATDFAIGLETCTAGPIAPSDTCVVPVTFSPITPGPRSATLRITNNAAGSPHTAGLGGTGVGPAVTLTPTSWDFGDQQKGTTSPPLTVTLRNKGNAPLNVLGVGLPGSPPNDFAVTAETCTAAPVTPDATCSISVNFSPTTTGLQRDTLTIDDDAFDTPQGLPVKGTGTSG
jgi:hypothetical protein